MRLTDDASILVAPDKFKGTLTAPAAARAITQGWRRIRPRDTIHLLPITDGGDGFGSVMSGLLHARPRRCRTQDAAHRPRVATWWFDPETKTAIIESAQSNGLSLLPERHHLPKKLDTAGLAPLFTAAIRANAEEILVGIGGSATNDGGFGLAKALGWQFLNRDNRRISRWTDLDQIEHLEPPAAFPLPARIRVAVDVQNPLLGRSGCTRVYGPQKGLGPADFGHAEACLARLARVVNRDLGIAAADLPGAGAAGGLGFGLRCFLNAQLEPGFSLFADLASLDQWLEASDLVITGEGALDASTFMGKGVGQIGARCRTLGIPCLALAGRIAVGRSSILRKRSFTGMAALTPDLTSAESAQTEPAHWLAAAAAALARQWTEPLAPRHLHKVPGSSCPAPPIRCQVR